MCHRHYFKVLQGTEKDEKTERRVVSMRQFGISEVEAAEYVGGLIDFYRGISEKPENPKPSINNLFDSVANQLEPWWT